MSGSHSRESVNVSGHEDFRNRRRRTTSPLSPRDRTTKYRRNGQLQACEPCRKSKLRCDHGLPHCGRCVRLKRQPHCVYENAPMSKHKIRTDAPLPSPSPGPISTPPLSRGFSTASSAPPATSPGSDSIMQGGRGRGSLHLHPGFLGLTSKTTLAPVESTKTGFDAVFHDHRSLAPVENVECSNDEESVPMDQIQRGVEVLRLLKYMPQFMRFINRLYKNTPGVAIVQTICDQWARDLWATFRADLESQDQRRLESLSALVWRNSATPLVFDGTTKPSEWIAQSTGQKLRWETIGIILGLSRLCFGNWREADPMFASLESSGIARNDLANQLARAIDMCVEFCRFISNPTDLLIWLWIESTLTKASIGGEGSFDFYMALSETINLMIAQGLHQEIKADHNVPFFLAELRKRTFAVCYFADIGIATFLGRPPRLVSRYCFPNTPLDITEEQWLCEDEDERQEFLSKLDSDGWNTEGKTYRTTWTRRMLSSMRIREDVLEISLGISDEDIKERAEAVGQKAKREWGLLPDSMRVDLSTNLGASPSEYLFMLLLRLEPLYNEFLLQRALIRRCSASTTKLVHVSQQILSHVLEASSRRDHLADYQMDLESLHVAYGLPSSAVLAIELLKQENERYKQLQSSSSTDPDQKSFNLLPRSDTIQDLSVFASTLAYVNRTTFGSSACEQGRKFLKHVLEKILDPPPVVRPPNSNNQAIGDIASGQGERPIDFMSQFPLDDGSLEGPFSFESEAGFVQWLENMDWGLENDPDRGAGMPSMRWKPTFHSL